MSKLVDDRLTIFDHTNIITAQNPPAGLDPLTRSLLTTIETLFEILREKQRLLGEDDD